MTNGWIKLHRQFIKWEWFEEPKTMWVFLKCLLLANHVDKKWQGVLIKSGSLITSYENLSSNKAKVSVQSVRTSLKRLKSTGELTIKTTNKYTYITINNWKKYQQLTGNLTNNQQTTNKQLTTNKNDKNVKNINININRSKTYGNKFVNYSIKKFNSMYGFNPIDNKPRQASWAFIQKIKGKIPKEKLNDENLFKAIDIFFNWVEKQDSLQSIKNIGALRRNIDVFYSQVK